MGLLIQQMGRLQQLFERRFSALHRSPEDESFRAHSRERFYRSWARLAGAQGLAIFAGEMSALAGLFANPSGAIRTGLAWACLISMSFATLLILAAAFRRLSTLGKAEEQPAEPEV